MWSRTSGRLLTPSINGEGYPHVSVGGCKIAVHSLVMLAFSGPCPDRMVVKTDNRHDSLGYDSYSANAQDAIRNGKR
ncbi:hypothetical protein [Trinickia sp. EG282A]|uniref:hypothetical protein n=1 Tax=Trinickia sp. EG282A TaxID=3237013 RepID=UPI0034D2D2C8